MHNNFIGVFYLEQKDKFSLSGPLFNRFMGLLSTNNLTLPILTSYTAISSFINSEVGCFLMSR